MSRVANKLVVASTNRHKVSEIAALLAEAVPALEVVGLDAWPHAPTIPETADTFEGNATLKAVGIATWLAERGEPGSTVVLADDSGLSVDVLGGRPGVHSARFAGPDANDARNNQTLVAALQHEGVRASLAHYTCVLVGVRVDRVWTQSFHGRADVEVRTEPRGTGGFGYDPHAWLLDGSRTVAELQSQEKAAWSHRGTALRSFVAAMRNGWITNPG